MNKLIPILLFIVLLSCQKNTISDSAKIQIESNAKTIDALKQEGEKFEINRDIFHWAYFRKQSDLKSFVSEIEKKNYKFVKSNEIEGEFPFQLQIKINSKISKSIMDEQVLYLVDTSEKFNGDYDGWETSVEN